MKLRNYLVVIAMLIFIGHVSAQDALPSVGNFGETINAKGAISAKKVPQKVKDAETKEMKVKGEVVEVCQSKGCWMTLDLGNGETMRVKFKDYGFFVPKDASGKTAIIHGEAQRKVVSVAELKHIAEDAGKSREEIDAIKSSKEELTFIADGVIIQ